MTQFEVRVPPTRPRFFKILARIFHFDYNTYSIHRF
jgi:hypothetical protein